MARFTEDVVDDRESEVFRVRREQGACCRRQGWRGGRATGQPILDEVLDPDDADGGRSRALRSKIGFTIVAAEPGSRRRS